MTWTSIPKPAESSVIVFSDGTPIGLLIAITKQTETASITSGWSDIEKPTSSIWTMVAKPIS